jgi:hypothetical protein
VVIGSLRDEAPAELPDTRSAEELRRLLVCGPVTSEVPPAVAAELFERHHTHGEAGAVDTALLLCTDRRWRRTSATVLADILRTQILHDAGQDELAERLLWPRRVDYVHPTGWLGTTFLEFELAPTRRRAPRRIHLDPAIPMTTPRNIWPPLRRWAATRMLSRHLAQPGAVIELARSLPAHDAAAVISGAVDAADHLPHRHARRIVEVALGWGHKSARKAALERLCSWGDAERALELAAKDPDASLRRWATDRPARHQPQLFD